MKPSPSPWGNLNKRQIGYMTAIYEVDQQKEANIKGSSTGWRWNNTPASARRWMPYNASGAALYRKITELGYVDPGTGSTFESLDRRGLILRKWEDSDVPSFPMLFVQITPAGRKLVRAALALKAPKALPVGTLREWHWRALCRAYVRGEEGMGYDQDKEDGFGYVSWNTCLRLRDYKVKGEDMALIREARRGEHGALVITEFGQEYYCENWARYQDMYLDVDAPQPE